MPAYFDTGFSVRKPMWHGLGDVLDEYPIDWADARQKAGLTWEPEERPAFMQRRLDEFVACRNCSRTLNQPHVDDCALLSDQRVHDGELLVTPVDAMPPGSFVAGDSTAFVRIPDHKLIVRPDTGLVLGVTSDEFSAIYHGEDHAESVGGGSMEEIIDAFRGADGSLRFETAGSVRDGRGVWALLYLDEPYQVPGDDTEHLPFLAVLNHHDGTGACKVVKTQVRVVCWNTWQMASAEGDRTGQQFTFRHVGDVRGRIDEAKATIAGLRTEVDEYVELAQEMMKLRVEDRQVDEFLSEFLPSPREQGEVVTDRVHGNVEKARAAFKRIYTASVTTDAVRGTAWGLVQTSTEYLDHVRAFRSTDSYLGRSVLRAEPAKAKALTLARRVAG